MFKQGNELSDIYENDKGFILKKGDIIRIIPFWWIKEELIYGVVEGFSLEKWGRDTIVLVHFQESSDYLNEMRINRIRSVNVHNVEKIDYEGLI